MNIDEQATDRVMKARSEVILTRRFYGVLVSNVEPVLSRQFPTMATNGKQHFFNPEFVMGLNKNHLGKSVSPQALIKGVQCHETEHDARHHGTRRGNRDPKKWNEACDYAINIDLIREGFELPEGALIDPRFDGMSAEDIYRIRELDEQRDKPQPPPPTPPSDDEESDDGDDDIEDQTMPGDDGEENEEPDSDDDEGDDDSEGDEQSDDDESDDGDDTGGDDDPSDDEGDDEAEGEGASSDDEDGDESSESEQGEGDADGEGEGEGEPQQSSGDPGMCGEVLDSAVEATDKAEEDIKWERIVREAASMARAVGQLPGHVSRDIERANNPGQDWREVLRAWFDQGALRIETWNKPNRRYVGRGLYLPGNQRDGINRAAFLIDTSGSMDNIALACIRNEAQHALDDGVIDEAIVVYGDTQVNRVDIYKTGDAIEFDPRGGGGTKLRPLFEHVRDNFDDVSLIVCFTDMENSDWGDEPSSPVLFAAHGYPDRVREYLATAPWNAPGIDVGEH